MNEGYYFQVIVLVHQNILRLEVSVNDLLTVHVINCVHQLGRINPSQIKRHFAIRFQYEAQRAVWDILQCEVQVVLVLKKG